MREREQITFRKSISPVSAKYLQVCLLAINPLSDNPTKWSNTFKQFFGNLPTNYLSVFDCGVGA